MDEITKLTKIVKNRIRHNVSILDLSGNSEHSSKEQLLFNGVLNGDYQTDEEASKAIYNSDPTDQRFRMLKSRLRQRLLSMLHYVDYKDSRVRIYYQYEQEALNYLYRAQILVKERVLDVAEKQVNKALTIARESEFTHVMLQGLTLLRGIYSAQFKMANFDRNIDELNTFIQLYCKEEFANNLYFRTKLLLSKSVNSRKKHFNEMNEAIDKLEQMWLETKSFNIFEKYYIFKIWSSELVGDFDEILKITTEVEGKVDNAEINPLRFDQNYNVFIKTYALLRTKNYSYGLSYAKNAMSNWERSSLNWFAHMENYFLLALHSKNYALANDILAKVYRNPHMDKLRRKSLEVWKLYKAYLYYISPKQNVEDATNFDQLYNDIVYSTKDKQGYNISLLILEFMHNLSVNRIDPIIDKIETLQRYLYRHLARSESTVRDKLFFKLLLVIIDSGFDPAIARKKGDKHYKKLLKSDTTDAFGEVEIIPYEHLWEHLIKILEDNVVKDISDKIY